MKMQCFGTHYTPVLKWIIVSLMFCALLFINKPAMAEVAVPKGFLPSDILMFQPVDWNNTADQQAILDVKPTYVGSPHQPFNSNDGDLTNHDRVRILVKQAHERGIKYIFRISTDFEFHYIDPALSCLDINLKPIGMNLMGDETPRPWITFHNPKTLKRLVDLLIAGVDDGIDGYAIDCPTLNYDVLDAKNGDFSSWSMANFRTYLASKYTSAQLTAMGIQDIKTFDYGEFIRKKYLQLYLKQHNKVPLYEDFARFQLKYCTDFWSEVIDTVRSYAKSKGRSFLFTANASEFDTTLNQAMLLGLPLADKLDLYTTEYTPQLPPKENMSYVFRLYADLGTPVALLPNAGVSAQLLSRPDISDLTKIFTAEAYASGGYFYVPHDNMCLDLNNQWKAFTADLKPLVPYYKMIQNNSGLYDTLDSKASIAVVYPFASALKEFILRTPMQTHKAFYGVSRLLQQQHIAYNVLAAGDDEFLKDRMTLTALKRHAAVILPEMSCMTEAQVQALLTYEREGGTVISMGYVGTLTGGGAKVTRKALDAFRRSGTIQSGKGKSVHLTGTVTLADTVASVNGKAMLSALRLFTTKELRVKAPETVLIRQGISRESNSVIIHAVNSNYNASIRKSTPASNLQFSVPIPSTLAGKALEIKVLSPEEKPSLLKPSAKSATGWIDFSLPKLETYSVIVIGESGQYDAGQAINILRESMNTVTAASGLSSGQFELLKRQAQQALTDSLTAMEKQNWKEAAELASNGYANLTNGKNLQKARQTIDLLKSKLALYSKAGRTFHQQEAAKLLEQAEKAFTAGQFDASYQSAQDALTLTAFHIDGKMDDWDGVIPLELRIESGNSGPNAKSVKAFFDGDFLCLALEFKEGASIQNPLVNYNLTVNGSAIGHYNVLSYYKDGIGNGSIYSGESTQTPVALPDLPVIMYSQVYEIRIPASFLITAESLDMNIFPMSMDSHGKEQTGNTVQLHWDLKN